MNKTMSTTTNKTVTTKKRKSDLSAKNKELIAQGKLIFSPPNAKLKKPDLDIITFDLPSGYTCPMANECLSFADRRTGKIKDGKNTQFRCFAASIESQYENKRKIVWHNFETMKKALSTNDINKPIDLIINSLPKNKKLQLDFDILRIHVHGDFFSDDYFLAWLFVAENLPNKIFYAYTKRVDLIAKYKSIIPQNFNITISVGGKLDNEIEPWMKTAIVYYQESIAIGDGLEIDHDDSHAYYGNKSFALLIHGTQPAKSKAGIALKRLKALGNHGYGQSQKPFNFIRRKNPLIISINQYLTFNAIQRKNRIETIKQGNI